MIFGFVIAIFVILFVKFVRERRRTLNVFKRLGIPGPPPNLFLGNILDILPGPSIAVARWQKQYGNTFGYFEGPVPVLVTSDLDIIKQVFIKDCSKFTGRKPFPIMPDPADDKMVSVILANGHRWKRIRSILSPTFSTNKLKQTTPLVMNSVNTLMELLEEKQESGESFNIMELFQGLTMDVISSAAFGLDIDAQRNKESKFTSSARQVFAEQNFSNLPPVRKCVFLLAVSFPIVGKLMFDLFRFLNDKKFIELGGFWMAEQAKKVIKERKHQTIPEGTEKRIDLLQLMMDAESPDEMIDDSALTMTQDDADEGTKSKNGTAPEKRPTKAGVRVAKKISSQEMVSNVVVFMLAGYETTSTALSYAAHELASNPDVQRRLQEELDKELSGDLPEYQSLSQLQYLDMVFSEVLRLHPIAPSFVTRLCMEDTRVSEMDIPAGMCVQGNVYSIHNNPEIWGPTDTTLFDPERFSPERKANRNPAAFLAFGVGPRNCVGMRFALLESKLALARILQKYNIEKCPESAEVLVTTEQATVVPKNGVMVKLALRN
ncbi:cytochrome P450 3A4-like isoform X1 [Lineus longissimus]|uniref:cytochrome P450 3A4-like isoform X1 n=1 Tax=Lineus longissimus TaxID=88925 RepID=UPI002B4E01A0